MQTDSFLSFVFFCLLFGLNSGEASDNFANRLFSLFRVFSDYTDLFGWKMMRRIWQMAIKINSPTFEGDFHGKAYGVLEM